MGPCFPSKVRGSSGAVGAFFQRVWNSREKLQFQLQFQLQLSP
ncbi:MAG: hypothetical protein ABEH38_09915 [Flavobacteriales bacterium]